MNVKAEAVRVRYFANEVDGITMMERVRRC
jgi:hypothetical protein